MSTTVSSPAKQSVKKALLPPVIGLLTVVSILTAINYQRLSSELSYVKAVNNPVVTTNIPPSDMRPRLIMPTVGIEAPVVYEASAEDEAMFQKLLERGVVHYPFTAKPNQTGNTVIFGHSSSSVFSKGNYKSIFANLGKAKVNDTVELYFEGTRYSYKVTGQKVIQPTDVSVLQPTSNARLTLITCWPVGSTAYRLIVTADKL